MTAKRELVRRVASTLPRRATVAVYPDHPFLLEPPDILAAQNGQLTSIFVLTAADKPGVGRNSYARYLLARLALPPHATHVMVMEDPGSLDDDEFEPVDDIKSVDGPQFRWVPERRPSRWNEATDTLRQPHFERFAEAWKAGPRARLSRITRPTSGRSTTSIWLSSANWANGVVGDGSIQHELPINETISQHQSGSRLSWRPVVSPDGERLQLTRTATGAASELRAGLTTACRAVVTVDYGLRLGPSGLAETASMVAGPGAYLPTHEIRLGQRRARRVFDVDRPFRSAAFAGFDLSEMPLR